MKIEGHNALGSPVAAELTQLVVRDAYGQPLLMMIEMGPDTVLAWKRGEPGFDNALRTYGVLTGRVTDQVLNLDLKPGDVRIG